MNLLIIGATQGIGLATLTQGLDAGHIITVLARSPQKITIAHPNLRIIKGNALDATSVAQAVQGQDVVIHCIGVPPSRKPITAFSTSTQVLLDAMQMQGVKRALIVTGIGAGDSRGHGGFFYDKLLQPLLLGTIYDDKDRQETIVKASPLDWTIVRPGMLSNGKLTAKYRISTNMQGVTAGKISRADVAQFLLDESKEAKYVKQVVLVD